MKKIISIIDCGMGNITSVRNAICSLNFEPRICTCADEISSSDYLILPGVGSFPDGIKRIIEHDLSDPIKEFVKKGNPLLGICLGMQIFANIGFEFEERKGLGFIEGSVTRLNLEPFGFPLPHVGWNEVTFRNSVLSKGLNEKESFYFVHSYAYDDSNASYVKGTCKYGLDVVSVIEKENVLGVQFHPEKSQSSGLKILNNFLTL